MRTWDVRSPARILDEVPFEARSRHLTEIGLAMYWVLLAVALTGLWRLRRRLTLLLPILAAVAAMAVVFTVDGGTRYRAPVEPLLVAACSAVPALSSLRAGRRLRRSGTGSADPSRTASGSRPRASVGVR